MTKTNLDLSELDLAQCLGQFGNGKLLLVAEDRTDGP
jgi:hypothetical protein